MSYIRLILLGTPRLEIDGQPIRLERRKAIAALAYLARMGESVQRETLATLLYPDVERTASLNNLRRVLWSINQATPHSILETTRFSVGLTNVTVDVDQFVQLVDQSRKCSAAPHNSDCGCAERWQKAAALYQGYFLSSLSLSDSIEFDTWQRNETQHLQQLYTGVLESLVQLLTANKRFDVALRYAQRWVATVPLEEEAQKALIYLLLEQGNVQAAQDQLDAYSALLKDELGIEAGAAVRAIFEDYSGSRSAETRRFTLPALLTSMLGRDYERATLLEKFQDPKYRLITITGSGGIGKTTLATAVAHQANSIFGDGIVFVDLSKYAANHSLADAIVDALSLQLFANKSTWEQLTLFLREKSLLLILDNFEHLLDQATLITDLLNAENAIRILVTSRERLRLREEWVLEISGLTYPNDLSQSLAQYEAVQLFIERANQADADYFASPDELKAIGRICQMVEGLPLALELAAAWTRSLSAEEIAEDLETDLDVLTHPYRNIAMRHRSLRNIFDHSWQRLESAEQHIFRQLAVFRGEFDRQAAHHITGAKIRILANLVDKSLLRRTSQDRFTMSEVVRQYAKEQLNNVPSEKEAVEARHAAYFLSRAVEHGSKLRTRELQHAVDELVRIKGNLLQAWRWLAEQGEGESLRKGAAVLSEFLEIRGHSTEAVRLFALAEDGLGHAPEEASIRCFLQAHEAYHHARLGSYNHAANLLLEAQQQPRVKETIEYGFALWQLGYVEYLRGNFHIALAHLKTAMAIFERHNDIIYLGKACNTSALVHAALGDFEQAASLLEAGIDYCVQTGYVRYHAILVTNLGNVACIGGDLDRGHELFEQCLMLSQSIDDLYSTGIALHNLAKLETLSGRYQSAVRKLEDCLALQRSIGHTYGIAQAHLELGHAHLKLGNYRRATGYLRDAMQTSQRIQAMPMLMEGVALSALVYWETNQAEFAVRLAAHVLSRSESDRDTCDQAQKLLDTAESAMPLDQFEKNCQIGRASSLVQLTGTQLLPSGQLV